MKCTSLEVRKFCKLFPKRKADELKAKKNDSGQVESKLELHSRTSQSLPTRGASYTSGSQTGHRRTLKILAFPGSRQARCPNSGNTALSPHLSCPHKVSKSAIRAGQSPGRGQNGPQGPLGTYSHHCLSLGRPSAPCLCLRGPGSPPSWSSSV